MGCIISESPPHVCAVPPLSARNIVLVGLMGAGKTTVGRALARRLRLQFLDSDHEVERRTGVRIPTIFEIEGEAGFRRREAQVISEILADSGRVVATGGGAVLDPASRDVMRAGGLVVYLKVSTRLLYERTRHDRNRPLLQVADPLARLDELFVQRDPLYREVAGLVIDGDVHNAHQIVQLIEKEFNSPCEKST